MVRGEFGCCIIVGQEGEDVEELRKSEGPPAWRRAAGERTLIAISRKRVGSELTGARPLTLQSSYLAYRSLLCDWHLLVF